MYWGYYSEKMEYILYVRSIVEFICINVNKTTQYKTVFNLYIYIYTNISYDKYYI